MPRFVKNLLLAIASVLIFFGSIEVVLSLLHVEEKFQKRTFLLEPERDYPQFFAKDRNLFWKFRPNQTIQSHFFVEGEYRINSHGFRDREFSVAKPPGTFRIVCLGNSCTFGWGVRQEETYPKVLEKILSDSLPGRKVEVINAGVTGYSSLQGLRLFEREILKLQPDLVTVCYGWNDHWPAVGGIPDTNQRLPAQWVLDLENFFDRLQTYRLLRRALGGVSLNKQRYQDKSGATRLRATPEEVEANLRELAFQAKARGISVILVTPPSASPAWPWNEIDYKRFTRIWQVHQQYTSAVRMTAQRWQIRLVDADFDFQRSNDYYDNPTNDYIHYNAKGHARMGQLLYEALAPQIRQP